MWLRDVNLALAGWLLVWAFVMFGRRRQAKDMLGGQWLAASWGALLLAIALGNTVKNHAPITIATPIVTIGLVCGLVAQYTAYLNARKGRL